MKSSIDPVLNRFARSLFRIKGGLLCGAAPVEDFNEAAGTYNVR